MQISGRQNSGTETTPEEVSLKIWNPPPTLLIVGCKTRSFVVKVTDRGRAIWKSSRENVCRDIVKKKQYAELPRVKRCKFAPSSSSMGEPSGYGTQGTAFGGSEM
jgi:hypothetical protein